VTKLMAALVLVIASGDMGLGATNCGFLTIEQCRATVTGGSSFCVPKPILQSAKACQGCSQTTGSTRLRDALRSLSVVRLLFGPRELKLAKPFGGRVLKEATLPEAQAASQCAIRFRWS